MRLYVPRFRQFDIGGVNINQLSLKLQTSPVLRAHRGCTGLADVGHVFCECRDRKCNVPEEHKGK